MAAAEELREEAVCAVCLDLFRAPVMLDCGHNFCRDCVRRCWARAAPSCPQCRRPLPGRALRPNRPLGNIAEGLRRLARPGPAQEEIQSQLESFRREKEELEKWERQEQRICQDRLEEVRAEREKIVSEFKQLRQLLEEQEGLLLARLGELEEQIETRLEENAAEFSKKRIYLDGLIEEQECQLSGQESLQLGAAAAPALSRQTAREAPATQKHDDGDVLSRCERAALWQKERVSHQLEKEPDVCSEKAPALEDAAKKTQDAVTAAPREGAEESQGHYTRVTVTLDSDTAQSRLVLSEDRRSVVQAAVQQSRPDSPGRFDPWPCVLGCQGFDSGRLCWEVEVGCGSCWAVGVALESVKRKGPIDMSPAGGIWAVGRYKEKLQALTSPSPTPVPCSAVPRQVRVCLDRAEGQVMFVDVDSEAVIFTFPRAMFGRQRLHPWFWVGRGSRLKLWPGA